MSIELDEIRKREKGLKIINEKIKNEGIDSLIDLTGLAGGFDVTPKDISLLEHMPDLQYLMKKYKKLV